VNSFAAADMPLLWSYQRKNPFPMQVQDNMGMEISRYR
jgi:hypothetical protein